MLHFSLAYTVMYLIMYVLVTAIKGQKNSCPRFFALLKCAQKVMIQNVQEGYGLLNQHYSKHILLIIWTMHIPRFHQINSFVFKHKILNILSMWYAVWPLFMPQNIIIILLGECVWVCACICMLVCLCGQMRGGGGKS